MKKGTLSRKISWSVIIVFLIVSVAVGLIYFVLPQFYSNAYRNPSNGVSATSTDLGTIFGNIIKSESSASSTQKSFVASHIETPSAVKGIYMSACAAGSLQFRKKLGNLLDTTELNTVVVDIKDFSGKLSYTSDDPELKEYASKSCGASDMREYLAELHSKGIYIIGRVTTFQDPYFTKLHPDTGISRKDNGELWTDKNGISYIDPGSEKGRAHVLAIAQDAYKLGFDEINFDYIRYPSDGNLSNATFPLSEGRSKPEVLRSFFQYLHDNLSGTGMKISADIFGMTTTNYDDLGIGQILENALAYFDYVSPMVYPSHYPATFNGWKNPNAYPYELIDYVMGTAVKRSMATTTKMKLGIPGNEYIASSSPKLYTKEATDPLKLRPWLQDFTLGAPVYGTTEVKAQIKATYDVGLTSWLLWNASNNYTADALLKE